MQPLLGVTYISLSRFGWDDNFNITCIKDEKKDGASDGKTGDDKKSGEEKKVKEKEPSFELLSNPSRVMRQQLKVSVINDKSLRWMSCQCRFNAYSNNCLTYRGKGTILVVSYRSIWLDNIMVTDFENLENKQ